MKMWWISAKGYSNLEAGGEWVEVLDRQGSMVQILSLATKEDESPEPFYYWGPNSELSKEQPR